MKKKRLLGILFGLALVLAIMPTQGMTVPVYADSDTDHTEHWSGNQTITDSRSIENGVTLEQSVTLTIAEGKKLTVNGSIFTKSSENFTLTVEGQGTLVVNGSLGNAGIVGSIVVNDGVVEITGGSGNIGADSANGGAVGGNGYSGVNGYVTVNGGTVTITGGSGGNGGNGGNGGAGIMNSLTVNGGKVNVNGGDGGKGGSGSTSGSNGNPGQAVGADLSCKSPLIFAESENGIGWTTVDKKESENLHSQMQYIKSAVGYPLWVGGVHVNSANMDNVLGDTDSEKATVKFAPANSSANPPTSATLTLNNAQITGKYNSNNSSYNIYSKDIDLTTVLKGENSIGDPNDPVDFAVRIEGDKSAGNLTIKGSEETQASDSLTVNGNRRAIMIQGGDLSVTDGAEIEATANSAGSEQAIYVMAGNVGGSNVGGSNVGGNITISGSKVTATGDAGGLITSGSNSPNSGNIVMTDSDVTAITEGSQNVDAISANGNVTISGGTVNATVKIANYATDNTNCDAIYAEKEISVTGGTVNATVENCVEKCDAITAKGNVTISGGTVNATVKTAEGATVINDCDAIYAEGVWENEKYVSDGKINITGGTVTATVNGGSKNCDAIYAEGEVNISGPKTKVTATTSNEKAIRGNNVSITNGTDVTVISDDVGINAYGGNLTINNSIVNANTNGEAICAVKKDAGGDISISNSTVTAKGSDALSGYEVELNNSTVTAEGKTCAIRAYDKIDIVDSKMDSTEGQIYTDEVLTIRDSRVIASYVANTLYGVKGINIEETENGDTYVEATIKKESGQDGDNDNPDIAIRSDAYLTITGSLAITEPEGGKIGDLEKQNGYVTILNSENKPSSHVIITTPDPSGGGNVPYVDSVQRVVNKIKALPDPERVTLNDEKAVNEANKAFNDLTDAQKGDSRLTPELKSKLEDCVNALDKARKDKEDQEAADKVSGMIDALPDDPEKAGKDDAQAAYGAYMALTDAQKALLSDDAKQKVAAYKYFYEVKYAEAQKVKMSSAKAKKGGKAVVKWKKNKAADGYLLYYKAKGVKAKKVNIKNSKTVKTTVKKLKDGKVYSFKVRSYTKVNDPSTGKAKKVYGKWSKAKKVRAKK